MKKILVLFITAISFNAFADSLVMPNTGGGEITLTNRQCKINGVVHDKLHQAYSWTREIYFEGCWTIIDGNAHVLWVFSDGKNERRVYPLNNFKLRQDM